MYMNKSSLGFRIANLQNFFQEKKEIKKPPFHTLTNCKKIVL
jgi:hypothetical protein